MTEVMEILTDLPGKKKKKKNRNQTFSVQTTDPAWGPMLTLKVDFRKLHITLHLQNFSPQG